MPGTNVVIQPCTSQLNMGESMVDTRLCIRLPFLCQNRDSSLVPGTGYKETEREERDVDIDDV
jgi:hypothetical protein